MTQRSQADSEVPSHPNGLISVHFSSVAQCVQLFATPWTAVCQASLSITDSWSLLRLMSVEPVMPSILNRYTVYIRQSSSPSLSHPPLCLCFHLPVLYN